MTHRFALIACLVLALISAAALSWNQQATAAPRPQIVSTSWNLDFEFDMPSPIAVKGVDGQVRWYWYITYTVSNNSGSERDFVPEFTVANDRGQIITAGRGVPSVVFVKIKELLGDPLLESPVEVVGRLLQGDDFAKRSVIVWPASYQDVDELRVFVSGLSGETAKFPNPLTGEPVFVRRTRMMTFATPGDAISPQDRSVKLLDVQDVMR